MDLSKQEKLVFTILNGVVTEALKEKEFEALNDVIVTKEQQNSLINLILYILGIVNDYI